MAFDSYDAVPEQISLGDGSGLITDQFKIFLERWLNGAGDYTPGKIISGQDALDQRITDAESSLVDLSSEVDVNTASLTALSTTSAGHTTSIASLSTELVAARDGESTLLAKISSIDTAISDETSARSSSVNTLVARFGGIEGSLVSNAFFQEEFSGTTVPPGWTSWDNGSGTWEARSFGDGYGFQLDGGAGANNGILQTITVEQSKKYLVAAEIRRLSGTLNSSGVYMSWRDSGNSEIDTDYINFANDENLDGATTVIPDGPTRWEKEVAAPTGAKSLLFYAMTHYSGFGSVASANSVLWRECSIKPLTNAQAQVTEQGSAIADIEGNLVARYGVAVDGGGAGALFSLEDGTAAPSNITLSASEIILDADAINFGSDTEFETTDNSFITETSGNRLRYGGPFGASSDLVQWFGPDSVSQGSETRTNGIFAFGTDGKVYYGSAQLGGGGFSISGEAILVAEVSGSGAGTATTGTPGIVVSGENGTVVYEWYQLSDDSVVSISSSSSANPTFSRAMGASDPSEVVRTNWRLVATDDNGSGDTTTHDLIVQHSNAF